MLGAIIGDVVGSRFEFKNIKSKDFKLFHEDCRVTDDTIMTIAVSDSILKGYVPNNKDGIIDTMKYWGQKYPGAGYGGRFFHWVLSDEREPYNSFGNGAAMRISPIGWISNTYEEVVKNVAAVTEVTHNHEEGIKGAEAIAMSIHLARNGKSKEKIKNYICKNYYNIDFTLNDIRDAYTFDVSCQGSVPQALEAFFESNDFEDAIRNAISIGGDSDTIACIAGSVAEAYYGVPEEIVEGVRKYLSKDLLEAVDKFKEKYK